MRGCGENLGRRTGGTPDKFIIYVPGPSVKEERNSPLRVKQERRWQVLEEKKALVASAVTRGLSPYRDDSYWALTTRTLPPVESTYRVRVGEKVRASSRVSNHWFSTA